MTSCEPPNSSSVLAAFRRRLSQRHVGRWSRRGGSRLLPRRLSCPRFARRCLRMVLTSRGARRPPALVSCRPDAAQAPPRREWRRAAGPGRPRTVRSRRGHVQVRRSYEVPARQVVGRWGAGTSRHDVSRRPHHPVAWHRRAAGRLRLQPQGAVSLLRAPLVQRWPGAERRGAQAPATRQGAGRARRVPPATWRHGTR